MFSKNSENSLIDSLLNDKNTTLKDILSEEGILTEVQSYNENLLDFLLSDEHMCEMLEILITTPEPDENGVIYFNFPNIVSNILSSFVTNIYERLSGNEKYLELLFQPFLKPNNDSKIVNSVTCSLIFKVAKVISQQCSEKMLEFLLKTPKIIDRFIDNIENYSVTEFLLRCMQAFPIGEMNNTFFEWLAVEDIIVKLLANVTDDVESEPVCLKSIQTLIEILLSVRQVKESNTLRTNVESSQTIDHIMNVMINIQSHRTALIGACFDYIKAIFEVPERPVNPAYGCLPIFTRSKCTIKPADVIKRYTTFQPIILCLTKRFPDFKKILENNNSPMKIETGYGGTISPPLGPHRLAIIDLLYQLMLLEQPDVYNALLSNNILLVLMTLFDKYFLNTFLHRNVTNILSKLIVFCFTNVNTEYDEMCANIQTCIFVKLDLLNIIIQSKHNIRSIIPENERLVRNVHWSFLRGLANTLNGYQDQLKSIISEDVYTKWIEFANSDLEEENEKNEVKRVGLPSYLDSSSDGDGAFDVEESEDIIKLYDECTHQKLIIDFPDYNYIPIEIGSGCKIEDLNSNPLNNLYIITQEDKENADKFESICNLQLMQRMDKSIEANIPEMEALHPSVPSEGEGCDNEFDNPFVAANHIPSNVIDDLFKEAYKERSNRDHMSIDLSNALNYSSIQNAQYQRKTWVKPNDMDVLPNHDMTNTNGKRKPLLPRLNFNKPILQNNNSNNNNNNNISGVVEDELRTNNLESLRLSRFEEIDEIKEFSNDDDLDEVDEDDDDDGEDGDDDDDDDVENIITRLRTARNKEFDLDISSITCDVDNNDNDDDPDEDDDSDIPLCSRLELGSRRSFSPELVMDPFSMTTPPKENHQIVQSDTVQDVTPDLVLTNCNDVNVNSIQIPHSSNLILSNNDHINKIINSPFSPKLNRMELTSLPQTRPYKQTKLPPPVVFESNKCLKLSHNSHTISPPIINTTRSVLSQDQIQPIKKRVFSSIISPMPWTSFQALNRSTSAPNKLVYNNDPNSNHRNQAHSLPLATGTTVKLKLRSRNQNDEDEMNAQDDIEVKHKTGNHDDDEDGDSDNYEHNKSDVGDVEELKSLDLNGLL